jgi:tryptophan synthase alpha chain
LSDAPLAARWAQVRARGRAALIPYITAGFPDAGATRDFLAGAADAGADVIELGIPWSDPVADGPVIQASTHAALRGGMTLAGALDLLADVRPAVPVVIFTYLNPVLTFGPSAFARRAADGGAAAVLAIDLPVGSDPDVERALRSSGLPLVRLVAPTTTAERLRVVAAASEGFVYLVARLGVTGRTDAPAHRRKDELASRIAAVRAVTPLPVAVGFGISEPAQAAEVAGIADGVVIGSAIVERLARGGAPAALSWLAEVRDTMAAAQA